MAAWEQNMSFHPGVLRLGKLFAVIIILAHWVSCTWVLISEFEEYNTTFSPPPGFTDLDLLTRQDFLSHLKVMSERDGVTVVYATHIFDGLDDWPTHLAFISEGTGPSGLTHA